MFSFLSAVENQCLQVFHVVLVCFLLYLCVVVTYFCWAGQNVVCYYYNYY